MKKVRRPLSYFLAFAVVALCIAPALVSVSGSFTGTFQFDEYGKFTIMQIADVQTNTSVPSRVVTAITRGVQRFHPDLVVLTGDNIIETIGSTGDFQSAVSTYLAPVINAGVKFAVTFGNHDDEGSAGSKTNQYSYYMSLGGSNFVDHDVTALDGVGSGVIPIYPYGQTGGTPAWQVYVMDSGSDPSSGSYDCCYTSQIDYYIQRSSTYPTVPSLWFQHIIVPDIYSKCMTTTNNGTGVSYDGYYIIPARYNAARSSSSSISTTYKEAPCPPSTSLYQSTAHRSSATYGSKTLYEAWTAYGNLKGAYFGHDHLNEFTCTTEDGIDLGYGESTTLYKTAGIINYNDDNPGVSIYELDANGTYTNVYYAESDIAVTFDANGGTGYMANQVFAKNSTKALSANAYTRTGYNFAGWATSPDGSVAYANGASYTAGTSDVTLYAKWTPKYYNITFNANGGTGGTGPTSMQATTALSAPAVSRTGYTLTGWSPAVPATVPFADTTYIAQWSPITYTVHYNSNGGTGGATADSTHTYDTAKALTTNGFTKTGYSMAGWATSSGGPVVYANGQSVTNLASTQGATVNLYAVWTVSNYNITFNANGGTGGTGPTAMAYGSPLTAPTVTRTGYTFTGWQPAVPATVPAADTTYTAQWTANSYEIIFNANGGTGGTGGSMIYGTALTAPTVTRTGYTFVGWSPAVPATVPAANTTYSAQWTANTYTVMYNGNGATGGSTANSTHVYDVAKTLTANGYTRTGYSFTGWATSAGGAVAYTNTQSVTNLTAVNTGIVTFYAVWSINSYQITFDANGGSGGTGPTSMVYNSPLTAPSVSRTGYTFAGWQPAVPATVPAAHTTYTAQWSAAGYMIIFDANGGTGGTGSSMAYGAELTAPAVTRTGYTFVGWSPTVPATVPAADMTFTAQWSINHYTISFNENGGSQVADITLDYGSAVTPPANPTKAGYVFTGWQPAVPATMPANNMTCTAQWAENTNNVVFSANGGSGGSSATLPLGTPITPPQMTRPGYIFTGWNPALPSAAVDGFNTYTAQWSTAKYQITFDANGGTGSTSALMAYGAALSAPAVSRAGYTFTGWSPAVPSTVPSASTTYTAQWTRSQVQITFDANGGAGGKVVMMSYGDALVPPAVTRAGYVFTGWSPAVPTTVVEGNRTYTAQWLLAD